MVPFALDTNPILSEMLGATQLVSGSISLGVPRRSPAVIALIVILNKSEIVAASTLVPNPLTRVCVSVFPVVGTTAIPCTTLSATSLRCCSATTVGPSSPGI